jgi:hypothetical protein
MKSLLTTIFIFFGNIAVADTSCLSENRREGAIIGTANFVGSPISGIWSDGTSFNLAGYQIAMEFGDEIFVYGATDAEDALGYWSDNLSQLTRLMENGATAVRYRDDSVQIIGENCQMSWTIRRGRPTTPVSINGLEVSQELIECMSFFSIMEFRLYNWSSMTSPWVDNPIYGGRMFLSFGPDIYALGQNVWGEWWMIPSHTCSMSGVPGAP